MQRKPAKSSHANSSAVLDRARLGCRKGQHSLQVRHFGVLDLEAHLICNCYPPIQEVSSSCAVVRAAQMGTESVNGQSQQH